MVRNLVRTHIYIYIYVYIAYGGTNTTILRGSRGSFMAQVVLSTPKHNAYAMSTAGDPQRKLLICFEYQTENNI